MKLSASALRPSTGCAWHLAQPGTPQRDIVKEPWTRRDKSLWVCLHYSMSRPSSTTVRFCTRNLVLRVLTPTQAPTTHLRDCPDLTVLTRGQPDLYNTESCLHFRVDRKGREGLVSGPNLPGPLPPARRFGLIRLRPVHSRLLLPITLHLPFRTPREQL